MQGAAEGWLTIFCMVFKFYFILFYFILFCFIEFIGVTLVKIVYRLQEYNFIIYHLYIVMSVYHPKSSLLLLLPSTTSPTPFSLL